MKDKLDCKVCFEPICTQCGIAYLPVFSCEMKRSKRISHKRKMSK